jgi:alpha-N-arabinofuranosidase
LKEDEVIQYRYPLPPGSRNQKASNPFSGNYSYRDDFNKSTLDFRYIFLRTVTDKWHNMLDKKGNLGIQLRPETVGGRSNPSFVGFRQAHHQAVATTKLQFVPAAENEKAGLVIFQNENTFYYLCKSLSGGKPVVQLYQGTKDSLNMNLLTEKTVGSTNQDVQLRIEPKNAIYSMSFSTDGKSWTKLQDVDGKILSTEKAGGFVGCVFGLYATSIGKPSSTKAYFDWFEYSGRDEVFE